MKVNVAVCGAFHYRNYVRYIDRAGLLNRFFYSHRISTTARSLGIRQEAAVNLWAKEYLIQLHATLTRAWLLSELAPLYACVWQAAALRRWDQCDILHVLLHGTALKVIRHAKSEGAKVIAEAVNQHPEGFNEILLQEAEHLGLKAHRKLHRIQERQLEEIDQSDFILVPSRIVRRSFVNRGYQAARIGILPYGVDSNRFYPTSPGRKFDRTFRVICVAQISPRKGQLYLLEAWKKLALPNAELLLIGSITYEMEAILRRYSGVFRHVPYVANVKLLEYYGRSSVFVLPTLEDGFAVVTGEAMASGLPVITTVNNGAADIIEHGRDGFVVPIRSPEAIAEHLELLYRDEGLRREMSGAAVAKARSELSWELYARKLCDFYLSVLKGENVTACPNAELIGAAT